MEINVAPTSYIPFLRLAQVDLRGICEKAGVDVNVCYTYGLIEEIIPVLENIEKFAEAHHNEGVYCEIQERR